MSDVTSVEVHYVRDEQSSEEADVAMVSLLVKGEPHTFFCRIRDGHVTVKTRELLGYDLEIEVSDWM